MKISKLGLIAIGSTFALSCQAEVVKFDIQERSIAFEGRVFTNVGTYTLIKAKAILISNDVQPSSHGEPVPT